MQTFLFINFSNIPCISIPPHINIFLLELIVRLLVRYKIDKDRQIFITTRGFTNHLNTQICVGGRNHENIKRKKNNL